MIKSEPEQDPLIKHCAYSECVTPFSPNAPHQKYCRPACRKRAFAYNGRSSGAFDRQTSAAISRERVTADLLGRGYLVYRSVVPSGSRADIVAIADNGEGPLFKVKVRTSIRRAKSSGSFPIREQPPGIDTTAWVIGKEIFYDPESLEKGF